MTKVFFFVTRDLGKKPFARLDLSLPKVFIFQHIFAFYPLYKQNTKDHIKLNTWKMKESVIEGKILPYFRSRRINEIKPRDVVNWQNTMMKMTNENGKPSLLCICFVS